MKISLNVRYQSLLNISISISSSFSSFFFFYNYAFFIHNGHGWGEPVYWMFELEKMICCCSGAIEIERTHSSSNSTRSSVADRHSLVSGNEDCSRGSSSSLWDWVACSLDGLYDLRFCRRIDTKAKTHDGMSLSHQSEGCMIWCHCFGSCSFRSAVLIASVFGCNKAVGRDQNRVNWLCELFVPVSRVVTECKMAKLFGLLFLIEYETCREMAGRRRKRPNASRAKCL